MLSKKNDAKTPCGENREAFAFDPADLKILSGAMSSFVGALERVVIEIGVNQASLERTINAK